MNQKSAVVIAVTGLIAGAIFGMAGSFVSSASLRCLAWGVDGIGLITASALLTVYYFRRGSDLTASGFLIFAIGEALILASSGIDINANVSIFGAGSGLWATALLVISFQKTFPVFIRITGVLAAILFAIVAIRIFTGNAVNALSKPLPFFAYPVFVITIFGWAWVLVKQAVSPVKQAD